MKEPSATTTLLRHARLVLPERTSSPANLLLRDGRIAQIFEADPNYAASAEAVIDLSGLTLLPGFIDVHIHGAVGVDTMAAASADLDRVSQFLAGKGVTAWLPTLVPGPADDYARSIKSIAGAIGSQSGAHILGVHYEGPFVNSAQCGALRSEFFRSFSGPTDLDALPVIHRRDAKHMITVAPEIERGNELVRELRRRGWIVSIGHTRAEFAQLDQAFAAGACHMTHFMNAMTPLHHRLPGPVAWGLAHDEVTCDIIADGIHLDPQILKLLVKLKGVERLMLISDAIAAAGENDGQYQIWGETITVKDGRTSNAAGHIAGSVITMLDAVGMMRSLGVSEVELARMASTNPARLLGIDQERGSIEEGKRADLVALNANGRVVLTIIEGAIAFEARDKSEE